MKLLSIHQNLQMTRLRMKQKNQSKKPLKVKRWPTKLTSEEKLLQNLRSTMEKSNRKNSKNRKTTVSANSKTMSTDEQVNSDPKAPKMAKKSSSRLKLEQYSGRIRKKWNQKRRVHPEHCLMEYQYVCIWHC